MINLIIKLPNLSNLKDEFLSMVDWNRMDMNEILATDPSKIMYAPYNIILQILKTQKKANASDEAVLSVIARSLTLMTGPKSSYSFNEDKRLTDFLTKFVDIEFRKKYHRQIMSMAEWWKNSYMFMVLFVTDGILPLQYLDGIEYYKMHFDRLNKLNMDDIRKIVYKTMYIHHQISYHETLDEIVIALPKTDLAKLGLPVPPPFKTSSIINIINGTNNDYINVLEASKYIDWDVFVDNYHQGLISFKELERLWQMFYDTLSSSDVQEIENSFETVHLDYNPSSFCVEEFL